MMMVKMLIGSMQLFEPPCVSRLSIMSALLPYKKQWIYGPGWTETGAGRLQEAPIIFKEGPFVNDHSSSCVSVSIVPVQLSFVVLCSVLILLLNY